MSELLSQQDYWNSRASNWDSYGVPLIPSEQDIDFHRRQLVAGGETLILGATPELCKLALQVTDKVTAVDYAQDVIDKLQIPGVVYECADWIKYFLQSSKKYNNVMTDGGLLCLDFPSSWQQIASQIYDHLHTGGIFSARVYLSKNEPPLETYDNPNLGRFVSSMGGVDANWMVHPKHGDYKDYDVRYAFPPRSKVLSMFRKYALKGMMVPDYMEGERFVSFAWQRA